MLYSIFYTNHIKSERSYHYAREGIIFLGGTISPGGENFN